MKWVAVIWLFCGGIGVSYSMIKERNMCIRQLTHLEDQLEMIAYYVMQWRMPLQEALQLAAKEEDGFLTQFYTNVIQALQERQKQDFGQIWKEESEKIWQEQEALRQVSKEIKYIWTETFVAMPLQPEAVCKRLIQRKDAIEAYRVKLQETYRKEQKLVFTMGFFVSAFFCLIFW